MDQEAARRLEEESDQIEEEVDMPKWASDSQDQAALEEKVLCVLLCVGRYLCCLCSCCAAVWFSFSRFSSTDSARSNDLSRVPDDKVALISQDVSIVESVSCTESEASLLVNVDEPERADSRATSNCKSDVPSPLIDENFKCAKWNDPSMVDGYKVLSRRVPDDKVAIISQDVSIVESVSCTERIEVSFLVNVDEPERDDSRATSIWIPEPEPLPQMPCQRFTDSSMVDGFKFRFRRIVDNTVAIVSQKDVSIMESTESEDSLLITADEPERADSRATSSCKSNVPSRLRTGKSKAGWSFPWRRN